MKKIANALAAMLLFLNSFVWLAIMPVHAVAAKTCTWSGATSGDMSVDTNWDCGSGADVPISGDALKFPATASNKNINNDITDLSVTTVTIEGTGYDIGGSDALTITSGISATAASADNTISADLVLGANVTIATGTTLLTLSGITNLATYTLTLTGSSIVLRGDITSDAGGSIVTSATSLKIEGDNDYQGGFTSNGGIVTATSKTAFGNAAGITIIGNTSTLELDTAITADETWSEPFTFNGAKNTGASAKLNVIGKNTNAVNVAGPYYILSGNITIGANMTVSGDNADLKITGALSGATYTIGPIDGNDLTVVIDSATNTTATTKGTYKSALKTTTVETDLSTTDGTLPYNNKLIIKSTGKYGNVTLSGGVLNGTGTVKNITMSSGTVAPGLSPGCLSSGNLTYTGGTLEIEINGTTECDEYDQVDVTGTVNLGDKVTTLTVTKLSGYTAAVDDEFVIINNDGTDTVTGTFKGLAEGTTVTFDGVVYTVSYKGGDGNDVVLTVKTIPATPNTGVAPNKVAINLLMVTMVAVAISWALVNSNKRSVPRSKR